MTRKVLSLLAICCILMLPFGSFAQGNIAMDAAIGYGGVITYARKVPVTVTLQNNGSDFQGTLAMDVIRGETEYDRYEMPVSVASGASVQVTMPVVLTQKQKTYSLRLMYGDTVVCESTLQPETVLNPYHLIVGTLGRTPQDLQYMSISQGSDPLARGEYWTPIALDAATFPADAESLRFFDLLVVDGFDLTTLTQQQQQAMADWLEAGGIVMVGGGAAAKENFAYFTPYTGITAGSVQNATDISGQQMNLLGIKGDGMGETVTQTALIGAKGTPLGQGPLVDVSAVGEGYVLTASFALCEKPLAQWMGRNVIWQRILLAGAQTRYQALVQQRANGSYDTSGLYADSNVTSSIAVTNTTKAIGPVIVLALFVLLAGVGGYLLLKKLDKREWMWALTPALAAVTAFAMWLFSLSLPIRDPVAVRYSVAQIDENGYTDSYTMLSAAQANQGPMTISLNQGTIDMAATAGYYASYNPDQKESTPSTLRYTYTYGAAESLTCQSAHAWEVKNFVVRNVPMTDISGVNVQCGWDGEGLVFTITNGSTLTLSDGVILTSYGYVNAPQLLPGQTAECRLAPAEDASADAGIQPTATASPYANSYPDFYNLDWNGVMLSDQQRMSVSMYDIIDNCMSFQTKHATNAEKQKWELRRQMLGNVNGLSERIQNLFLYAAFTDELDQLQVFVDGKPVQRQAQQGCVIVQAHYNPIAADGSARFLSNSFPVSLAKLDGNQHPAVGEQIATSGYQTYNLTTDQLFAIDMRALPDNLEITGFDISSRYNYYSYNVSLYNVKTEQWDDWKQFVVDRSTGRGVGTANMPDLDQYLQNGFLFVRFDNAGGNDYAEVSAPVVTVEGSVH